jgi:MoaA/NifB/PqqE/SkfB family radical SAM enzyme
MKRHLELTTAVLAELGALPEALVAQGVREVVLVMPASAPTPASFRNAAPLRPDLPVLLDVVAPVQRFATEARALGLTVELRGFAPGIFEGVPAPPVTAMIEVSSRCNLRCPLCSVGRGALSRKGDMPIEVFARLVGELAPTVRRLALHNLGEPLLHRDLPRLVQLAKEAGIPSVFLSTNLAVDVPERIVALAHSGIDEIVCSLDAAQPETYPIYRVGGRFEVVLRNLQLLTEARRGLGERGPRIRLQFLLFRHNESERAAFREMARAHGVGYEIKVASAPPGEAAAWLPADPSLHRTQREPDHGWCTRPYDHTTVLSTGAVVPCCKDADGKHVLGDVTRESFASVWGGAAFQAFRERLRTHKQGLPLCRSCPGGWFLGSNVVERGEDPWPA